MFDEVKTKALARPTRAGFFQIWAARQGQTDGAPDFVESLANRVVARVAQTFVFAEIGH